MVRGKLFVLGLWADLEKVNPLFIEMIEEIIDDGKLLKKSLNWFLKEEITKEDYRLEMQAEKVWA